VWFKGAVEVVLLAVSGAVLPGAAVGQDAVEARGRGGVATVHGYVVEHESGAPVTGAAVTLASLSEARPGAESRPTDRDGRFVFPRVAAGSYLIRVGLIGFQPREDTLVVESGRTMRVSLELSVSPIALDPIVVEVENRRMSPAERRAESFGGVFIGREEFIDRNPIRISDIFRTIPGAILERDAAGGYQLRSTRDVYLYSCTMPVFVDGVRSLGEVDTTILPEQVEAVEVYTSLTMPPQFGPSRCGAVAIWLRGSAGSDAVTPLTVPGSQRALDLGKLLKGLAAIAGLSILALALG
jgi:hypothetical protein